jgi:histidinol-phosphate/aromatic aminotransferase/cobyric acid decarboxylase-like protein
MLLKRTTKDLISSLKTLGIVSFPTETFFFLIKVPYENIDADEFANRLAQNNIHVRPLHLKGLENKYIRFATSTVNNNEIVINTIKEILGKICI